MKKVILIVAGLMIGASAFAGEVCPLNKGKDAKTSKKDKERCERTAAAALNPAPAANKATAPTVKTK